MAGDTAAVTAAAQALAAGTYESRGPAQGSGQVQVSAPATTIPSTTSTSRTNHHEAPGSRKIRRRRRELRLKSEHVHADDGGGQVVVARHSTTIEPSLNAHIASKARRIPRRPLITRHRDFLFFYKEREVLIFRSNLEIAISDV